MSVLLRSACSQHSGNKQEPSPVSVQPSLTADASCRQNTGERTSTCQWRIPHGCAIVMQRYGNRKRHFQFIAGLRLFLRIFEFYQSLLSLPLKRNNGETRFPSTRVPILCLFAYLSIHSAKIRQQKTTLSVYCSLRVFLQIIAVYCSVLQVINLTTTAFSRKENAVEKNLHNA